MKFDPASKKYELVERGFCQLSLTCFKHIYNLLKKDMKLPDLSSEPEIIPYGDNTYALSWWPHFLYRRDIDEPIGHLSHAEIDDGGIHKRYLEVEA